MPNATLPQGIERGKTYVMDAFKQLSRWGDYAVRMAKKRGLRVRRAGGQSFVSGDDFFDYLDRIEESSDE